MTKYLQRMIAAIFSITIVANGSLGGGGPHALLVAEVEVKQGRGIAPSRQTVVVSKKSVRLVISSLVLLLAPKFEACASISKCFPCNNAIVCLIKAGIGSNTLLM